MEMESEYHPKEISALGYADYNNANQDTKSSGAQLRGPLNGLKSSIIQLTSSSEKCQDCLLFLCGIVLQEN